MSNKARRRKFEVTAPVDFRDFYQSMKDDQMKRSVDGLVDALEQRPLDAGDFVARKLWPDEYKTMGLNNVYKADLAKGARLTYTVTVFKDGSGMVKIIEFFATHKDYAKKFGYDV